MKHISGPTIVLSSGEYFSYVDPDNSNYTLEDIAHALSMICRFAGHSPVFYSVAEHSVHCSYLVPREFAWADLMHDAAEAFVGDIASPLKNLLPDYKAIEERVFLSISKKFDVPNPLPEVVKKADAIMLATEKLLVLKNYDDWSWNTASPADIIINPLNPQEAKKVFLDRARDIRPI